MPNGGYFYIEKRVLEAIFQFKQVAQNISESGGLLAGYYKGNDLHVVNFTTPQVKDKKGRFHFHRRDLKHVNQVRQWYIQSGGSINCLGEWHTHPESYPSPSTIDTKGWKRFIKDRNGQQAVFVIIGLRDNWAGGFI